MSQIEIKLITKFKWWNNSKDPIDSGHAKALKESAMEHIRIMTAKGYDCGTLFDNIHMHDTNPESGIEYNGWWDTEWEVL